MWGWNPFDLSSDQLITVSCALIFFLGFGYVSDKMLVELRRIRSTLEAIERKLHQPESR